MKTAANADFSDEVTNLRKVIGAARPSVSASDGEKARLAQLARQQEQQPSLVSPSPTVRPSTGYSCCALFQIESMDVQEGVTLVEGAKTKAGPQRKADSNHMSLKDFQVSSGTPLHCWVLSSMHACASQNYGGGSGSAMPLSPGSPEPVAEAPPPPEPEHEPEPEMDYGSPGGGGGLGDAVPLKDLPHPPKVCFTAAYI